MLAAPSRKECVYLRQFSKGCLFPAKEVASKIQDTQLNLNFQQSMEGASKVTRDIKVLDTKSDDKKHGLFLNSPKLALNL